MNGTFEGAINRYARQAIADNPSLAKQLPPMQGVLPSIESVHATDVQIASGIFRTILPDKYLRVFHPRANGHQVIANLVLYHAGANNAARLKQEWPSEQLTHDTCPAKNVITQTPAPPPAADLCGDWYKVILDHFEIYGKNFDAEKFGHDGSGLKQQLSRCGEITNWEYKTLTDDLNGYQWYASGNQPIGTKACVGRAVVSAGGKDPSRCTGSG